jgi:RNase P/RNase MRP subunit POP5
MVKFKSRYVLLETLFEDEKIRSIDPAKYAFIFKKQVESMFGNVGAGKLNKNLQVKYVNNVTNLMTVRVGKEFVKLLLTVLSLMNEVEGDRVKMHVIAVSGTIKKIEIKAKKFLENWTLNYEKMK